jgi:hypothetical protein
MLVGEIESFNLVTILTNMFNCEEDLWWWHKKEIKPLERVIKVRNANFVSSPFDGWKYATLLLGLVCPHS